MSPSRQKEQSLELSAVAGFPARVRNDRLLFKEKDDEWAPARALFPGFPTRAQKHRLSLQREGRRTIGAARVRQCPRQGRPPAPPGSRASPARVAEVFFRRLVLRVVWAGPCQGCPPIEPSAARNPSGRPALRVRRLICPACSRVCGACQARFASVRVVWSPSSLNPARVVRCCRQGQAPPRTPVHSRSPALPGSLAGPARVTRQALPARTRRVVLRAVPAGHCPRQGCLAVPARAAPGLSAVPAKVARWPAKLVLRVSQCYGRSSNVSTPPRPPPGSSAVPARVMSPPECKSIVSFEREGRRTIVAPPEPRVPRPGSSAGPARAVPRSLAKRLNPTVQARPCFLE